MIPVVSLEDWRREERGRPAVVAIGNFDGVHRAHRRILSAAVEEARARGADAVAVTFEPHPARILRPLEAPRLLTPEPEKSRQLACTGVDAVVRIPFSRDLSLWTPREFVERVLVLGLGAVAVHEGDNFRFGHRHQGDIAALRSFGGEFGFRVTVHPPVAARGEMVSSSRIRELLAGGDVARARAMLGRPFAVEGPIAPGRGVGRQRTVPTLNLQHYEEALPAAGVYLTRVWLAGAGHWAATNVGVRPTFGPGGPLTVESHLLRPPAEGIAARLGDPLRIAFLRRLREERRFASPEQLLGQIQSDIAFAERYFRRLDSMSKGGRK